VSLVADFGSSTGHAYEKWGAGSRELAYHEYLFLRRFFRERKNDLESVVGAIVAEPHRRLREEVVSCPVEQVAAPDPVLTVRALCAGEHLARLNPGHPLTRTPLGALLRAVAGESVYPARLPLRRCYHDFDTPENRFAKFVLEDLEERVRALTQQLPRSGNYLNPDIEDVLVRLGRQSSAALEDPFWREIGALRMVPVSSQVLQRKEGYRQLYGLYSWLQQVTRQDYTALELADLLETKDTATLFEYWCFFVVKEVLETHVGLPLGCRPIVSTWPERQAVERGLELEYGQKVFLWFNRLCPAVLGGVDGRDRSLGDSYSRKFRPDILISRGSDLLVLDAKNKGRKAASMFYGEENEGRVRDVGSDDVNNMHAYRDALTGAVGAFALYPGENRDVYRVPGATRDCEGVGALPLRPREDATVEPQHREWLREMIESFLGCER